MTAIVLSTLFVTTFIQAAQATRNKAQWTTGNNVRKQVPLYDITFGNYDTSTCGFQRQGNKTRVKIDRPDPTDRQSVGHHRDGQYRAVPTVGKNGMRCFVSKDDSNKSSFLSTGKATVRFGKKSNDGNVPANLSPIDSFILSLTSDRVSLIVGSIGLILILINRVLSFPDGEDAASYQASRSRIDLLGVLGAGSVLLNGLTKLDVESVKSERVMLEGVNSFENKDGVVWTNGPPERRQFQVTVQWALTSFIKCSPTTSAVLLSMIPADENTIPSSRWRPIAMAGILPTDVELQTSLPDYIISTPLLDKVLANGERRDTVAKGVVSPPKETYLPTLQALPGKDEFTYLPLNTQEVLILPVSSTGQQYFAIVLGGDTSKSFTPRDIAWCCEIASWVGTSIHNQSYL